MESKLIVFRDLKPMQINSITGGLQFGYYFNSKFYIQSGVLYDRRQAAGVQMQPLNSGTSSYRREVRIDLQLLTIPVMFGYEFSTGAFRPYLAAGLEIGTGIGEDKIEFQPLDELQPWEIPTEPDGVTFKKSEHGIAGELGFRYHLSQFLVIGAHARYAGSERTMQVSQQKANIYKAAINIGSRKAAIGMHVLVKFG
ncbi:MAG: outer membrane beta-barrel protein [Bacteroidota bacterium]